VCQRRLGDDVVGEAVRELRQGIRRQRRDHHQIGALQVRIQLLGRRTARQRMKGLGPNEALGAWGHQRQHVVPALDQQANYLARFVGGDPAGDSDQDPGHSRRPTACSRA
jgi:hypothetical protein